ncbi:hypothetical protein ACIRBX_34735 [Kitasatospora sp. NPDC096147]|uniref:hypothetical protein n=1 Tax=Kitasatospora sp. NPDC096147 TaxID=3364093 RepID=UPI0037F5BA70
MTVETYDPDGADQQITGPDLTGFRVEALDARLGRVEQHIEDEAGVHLLVAASLLVSGEYLLLPPGVVARIDLEDESVWLNRTLAVVEGSPLVELGRAHDPWVRHTVDAYYAASA